ncbi:hypothetical protein BD770DRAFT_394916 [Pilaira anomala]|nr:hypothetical protein BD770DRAFT_394916 [Pilaira anomala]
MMMIDWRWRWVRMMRILMVYRRWRWMLMIYRRWRWMRNWSKVSCLTIRLFDWHTCRVWSSIRIISYRSSSCW